MAGGSLYGPPAGGRHGSLAGGSQYSGLLAAGGGGRDGTRTCDWDEAEEAEEAAGAGAEAAALPWWDEAGVEWAGGEAAIVQRRLAEHGLCQVCVCVRARARACVHACVRACVLVRACVQIGRWR